MSDYRRFVAYIYEYTNGKKNKNTGFAKVESRNGICRMQIHLHKIPREEKALNIYGFVREGGWLLGILIGKLCVKGAVGEAKLQTAAGDIKGSGYALSQLAGLWVESGQGRRYLTVFDDEGVDTAKLVTELPKTKMDRKEEEQYSAAGEKGAEIHTEDEKAPENHAEENPERDAEADTERSVEEKVENRAAEKPEGCAAENVEDHAAEKPNGCAEENVEDHAAEKPEGCAEENVEDHAAEKPEGCTEEKAESRAGEKSERHIEEKKVPEGHTAENREEEIHTAKKEEDTEKGMDAVEVHREEGVEKSDGALFEEKGTEASGEAQTDGNAGTDAKGDSEERTKEEGKYYRKKEETEKSAAGNPGKADMAERGNENAAGTEKAEAKGSQRIRAQEAASCPHPGCPYRNRQAHPGGLEQKWQILSRRCPHVQPFEDGEASDCIQITPRELSILRQGNSQVGNNSFLMHGFCNYRHLLFGRMRDGSYLLGIPGMFENQELFMANMFGFPEFKDARSNHMRGRFGYWCRRL